MFGVTCELCVASLVIVSHQSIAIADAVTGYRRVSNALVGSYPTHADWTELSRDCGGQFGLGSEMTRTHWVLHYCCTFAIGWSLSYSV